MPTNNLPVHDALETLFNRFIARSKKFNNSLPYIEWDETWSSACITTLPDEQGKVQWQPTPRTDDAIFSAIEKALNVKFHDDLIAFYSSFWSDGIICAHETGEISLIQIWNQDDEEMLKENLLGHAFAKIKNRLPLTLFVGCTNDDQVVCVDNTSGKVVLEKPGFAANKELADSLSQFLNDLTPTLKPYNN